MPNRPKPVAASAVWVFSAVSMALLFLTPIVTGLLLLLNLPQPIQIAIATLAAISASAGVLTERWLFFAEAEHVVVLYYRGGTA